MVRLTARLERLEAAAGEAMLGRLARDLAAESGLPVEVALAELRREAAAVAARHARHRHGPGEAEPCASCLRRAATELGIPPEELLREAERITAGVEAAGSQTAALFDAAEAAADPLLGLWIVAALTGARKSELLGLTWDDVDLEAGTLCIRPTAVRDVKTTRSRRTLDLDSVAVVALKAHRDRQAFHKATLREAYAGLGLVFASELGTMLDPHNVAKRFERALRRAGLPHTTRLHDLRHGVATMLLEAGETVPTVSEYLGHASPAVTMSVYAHAVPGSKRRAAERIGSILRNARSVPNDASDEAIASG